MKFEWDEEKNIINKPANKKSIENLIFFEKVLCRKDAYNNQTTVERWFCEWYDYVTLLLRK